VKSDGINGFFGFLILTCSFCYRFVLLVAVRTRARSGLQSRRWLSTLPSKSMPTLSREASAPVGLALTFGLPNPEASYSGPRARLKTPLTIRPKSYNSRQTVATEWPIVLNAQAADST
jgi:hypothetical protein